MPDGRAAPEDTAGFGPPGWVLSICGPDGILLAHGNLRARLALSARDRRSAMALRGRAFRCDALAPDGDRFDAGCAHLLIECDAGSTLGCLRMALFGQGGDLSRSCSAASYDLSRLEAYPGAALEIGRFCTEAIRPDPHVLRLAWAALTRVVDATGTALLFGCASFPGADPAPHRATLDWLFAHHLGPEAWRPGRRSPHVVGPSPQGSRQEPDPVGPWAVPPLLRTYLAMGGWVGDHAVVDAAMDTVHVFTAVEVARIPEARKRRLRALAG